VIKHQDEGSPIVDAAHAINHGQVPLARSTAAGDLYILRAKSATEDEGARAQRMIVESAVRLGAQVLSPQHNSATGVSALNRALQARLNPPQPGKPEVQISSEVVFRLGDRVLIGKNNAGKSTVLHALTLLAQTVERPNPEQLSTSGERVDLGNDPLDLTHGPRHEGWGISLVWEGEVEGLRTTTQLDVKTHQPSEPYRQIFDTERVVSIRLTDQITIRVAVSWPFSNQNEAFRVEATGPNIALSTKAQAGMSSAWNSYPATSYSNVPMEIEAAKEGRGDAIERLAYQVATPLLMHALPQSIRSFRYVGADRHVKSSAFEVRQGPVENPKTAEEIVNALAFNRTIRERVSADCRRVFTFGIDSQLIAGPKLTLVAVDENVSTLLGSPVAAA